MEQKEGDVIDTGDAICEVETDKASMNYESSQEGTLLKSSRVKVRVPRLGRLLAFSERRAKDIAEILKEVEAAAKSSAEAPAAAPESTAVAPAASPAPAAPAASKPSAPAVSGRVKASPLARKLASQKGIDISTLSGSGPAGRVVKRDIENYKGAASGATAFAPAVAAGQDLTIPVSGKRAVIAKRLAESKFSAPHYYVKNKVAMDNLIAARNMLNKEVPEKVGFNAFMIKFAAEAIKRHPEVNASWQGDNILQFGSIDIGIAVDLGNGLITPIVRNVGNKGVVQIDAE